MIIGCVSWSEVNTGKLSLSCVTCGKHRGYAALDDDWCRPCLPRKTGDWLMFLVQLCDSDIKTDAYQKQCILMHTVTRSTYFLHSIVKTEMQIRERESQRG